LIRLLGLGGVSENHPEERDARRAMLQAALKYLEESRRKAEPELSEVYDDLEHHYQHRLATLAETGEDSEENVDRRFYRHFIDLSRQLLKIERQTAVQLRNQRRINDELLRELEHELDLGEAKLIAKRA
jgi:monovalent cation/hydrogen antiporter